MYIRIAIGGLQNSDGLGTYNVHIHKRDWEDALKSTVLACTDLTFALVSSIAAVIA